ncbi:universal stress protein [Arthrobacter antioxidans]|uniref:universal stress protein n=1 Tax=Arthrobacter antioxidans TaxID=2895818 RepID=UPI001FFF31CC|nr:universal stress protein [Arthrobacter antioxidans]
MTTVLPEATATKPPVQRSEPMLVAMRDSAADRPAVEWAAARAAALDAPLTVLHAITDPSLMPPGRLYGDEVIAGRVMVSREASRVAHRYPGLRVSTYLHCGDVVEALLGLSAAAPMIVVGADRRDPTSGEYKGSVALQVALNSATPVAVVPPAYGYRTDSGQAGGGVVVGVDGSEVSRAALMRAAEEAHSAGMGLTVVTALGSSPQRMAVGAAPMLLAVRTRYPDLLVSWVVDDLHTPVEALALYGTGSDLLVIGRHGSGARSAMSLGSVTHTLLLEPPCPTLVLTHREPEPPDGSPTRTAERMNVR